MICAYCEGEEFQLRRRTLKNGGVQFVEQCLTCGRAGSQAISRAALGARAKNIPPFDDGLSERWEKESATRRAAEKAADRTAWFNEHNAYLRTEEWRLRRMAVLTRAKGICEGCGAERATQVHHLTYEHWKHEFLWELVAICDHCHERVHRDSPGHV